MKKQILSLGKTLSKKSQKEITGGLQLQLNSCAPRFFCAIDCWDGDRCAIPNGMGGVTFGTVQNNECCPV